MGNLHFCNALWMVILFTFMSLCHASEECDPEYHYQCTTPLPNTCNCHNVHTLCDGYEDCPSGEDEDIEFCKEQCISICGGWCNKFKRCLHRTQVCDGSRSCKQVYEKTKNCKKVDCPAAINGTDMGYTRCGNWPQCVLIDDVCNAARDGTESPCKNGWFPDGSSQLCGETTTTLGPTPTPYEIDGIFADCSASIPPSVIYSGPAEPIRQVGHYDGGVSVCESALYAHNKVRQNHANTPHMVYNDVLAAQAESWAMHLANTFAADTSSFEFEHSTYDVNNGAGENLFRASATSLNAAYSVADAVYPWYNEMITTSYDFAAGVGTGGNGVFGHFTQVVWAESTEVGCGVARFVNGLDWHTFVVCQYESAGNVNGQYQQQVQPLIASATVPSGPGYLEAQSNGCILKAANCNVYGDFCVVPWVADVCQLICNPECS